MNLDFLLLIVVYLAIILYFHYHLYYKHRMHKSILKDNKKTIKPVIPERDSRIIDSQLLLSHDDMKNASNNGQYSQEEYLKYFNLTDNIEDFSDNVGETNNLEKYFNEIQTENYKFNPVPTQEADLNPKDTPLSQENVFGDVYAFDEFNHSQFSNQYETIN